MSRFTFLHAADLHLDTPFAGLGRMDGRLAETLRDASLLAWDRLVREALEREVAFVVLAGDIYDGAERGLRAQLRFYNGCAQLAEHGISVFIVHGNHDPLSGWSALRSWPDTVKIFPAGRVEAVPVWRDGRRLATVSGISYDRPDVAENLALLFPEKKEPEGGFAVGILHCAVGDIGDHAPYSPCTLDDLRGRGIDYWALGHVHDQAVLENQPAVVYPGCIQGRSAKPGETGPKGAVVVSVADERVVAIEPIPLAQVVFDEIRVSIDEIPDAVALTEALSDLASEHAHRAPGGAILTARLTGSGAVHDDLRRPGARAELLQSLRETTGAQDGRIMWWAGIRDQSTPAIDWGALRERDDLVAAIIHRGDKLLDDPEAAHAVTGNAWKMADRLARTPPDEEERRRLLTEALRLAVMTLESDR